MKRHAAKFIITVRVSFFWRVLFMLRVFGHKYFSSAFLHLICASTPIFSTFLPWYKSNKRDSFYRDLEDNTALFLCVVFCVLSLFSIPLLSHVRFSASHPASLCRLLFLTVFMTCLLAFHPSYALFLLPILSTACFFSFPSSLQHVSGFPPSLHYVLCFPSLLYQFYLLSILSTLCFLLPILSTLCFLASCHLYIILTTSYSFYIKFFAFHPYYVTFLASFPP